MSCYEVLLNQKSLVRLVVELSEQRENTKVLKNISSLSSP